MISSRRLRPLTTVACRQVRQSDCSPCWTVPPDNTQAGVRSDPLDAVIGAVQNVLGRGRDEAAELMRVAAHSARDSERTRRALERLDRHLTHGQRLRLLEWLWRIAFADAEIVAQEEYLIRKISEILGLATADVIEAKVRAKESFG